MKRSMCGIILLAAAGLWSCNGDPTGGIREGERLLADPASVFVEEGASKFVTVELVDGQGNQLAADFNHENDGAGITVAEDTTFLQTTIGTRLPTQERFVVTGVTPASSSFDVVSGGQRLTIPVRVLPTSFAATVSNAAPVQNEIVTFTAPSGFTFGPDAAVVVGADTAPVSLRAADGSAIAVVVKPGLDTIATRAVPTVSDVRSALYPSVPLEIPILDSMTVAPVVSLPGTTAPGSAPVFPGPGVGGRTVIFDKGTFTGADITGDGGTGAQYYQINVTEAGDYQVSVNWDGPTDVDGILCFDAACSDGAFLGTGTAQPEASILTLTPQVYFLAAVSFHADTLTIPPRVAITVTRF